MFRIPVILMMIALFTLFVPQTGMQAYAEDGQNQFTVIFKDGYGNTLKTEKVARGQSATPPAKPVRKGLLFDKWFGNYENVTSDETVNAHWKKDPAYYGIWVGNTPVNDKNKDDILNDGGKAKFDPSTNTLTLNNPTIKELYSNGYLSWDACIYADLSRPLVVKGKATLTNLRNNSGSNGIMTNGDVELNGDFTIKAGYQCISSFHATISGGNIKMESPVCISVRNTVTIKGGTLKCTGQTPIIGYGGLSISDNLEIAEPEGGRISNDGREIVDSNGKDVDTVTIMPKYFTVTFVDGQGKTLKTETVRRGKSATAPAAPTRKGYTFVGWNKAFSNITSDLRVTAMWKKATPDPKPVSKVSGTLLNKMTAKGKTGLMVRWNKIKGAAGYDIFFGKCGEKDRTTKLKRVRTIKGNKTFQWTKKGLKEKTAYKAFVKAYVMKKGKKTYVRTGPAVHAFTSGSTKYYTNPKGVTVKKSNVSLKVGKTYKIKAGVAKLQKGKKLIPADHAPKLRYISSNKKIARVSKTGKITAKAKGSCKVYVIAANGVRKVIKVTVKNHKVTIRGDKGPSRL